LNNYKILLGEGGNALPHSPPSPLMGAALIVPVLNIFIVYVN